jgi:ABC-2 type transport system permease protein
MSSQSQSLRVTQGRVIVSEWVKLRSTVFTLVAAVGITVGLGLLFAVVIRVRWGTLSPADQATLNTAGVSLRGVFLAQLATGVLGILLITGEYATGMIRATLSAVPRRLPVLWAKLSVFGAVATVTCVISALAVFLAAQAVFGPDRDGASLASPGVARAVLGAGLYLAMTGLLGMALGFIIRNTAGAITTLFAILLILPVLGDVLPASWAVHIVPYLPSEAGQAVMQLHSGGATMAPWTGFALYCAYTAAAIALAAVLLRRRDA